MPSRGVLWARPRYLLLAVLLIGSSFAVSSCQDKDPSDGPADTVAPATTSTFTVPSVVPAFRTDLAGIGVDSHKVVGCMCCHRWAAYLRDHGAEVWVKPDPELTDYKRDVGVPSAASSCHTALIEGYVVEGHVPVEAILKMLNERPEAIGIATPGMPPDSPGMGGDESTWITTEVFLIGMDGELTPYEY